MCSRCKKRISESVISESVKGQLKKYLIEHQIKLEQKKSRIKLKEIDKEMNAVLDMVISNGRDEVLIKRYNELAEKRMKLSHGNGVCVDGNLDEEELSNYVRKYVQKIVVDFENQRVKTIFKIRKEIK